MANDPRSNQRCVITDPTRTPAAVVAAALVAIGLAGCGGGGGAESSAAATSIDVASFPASPAFHRIPVDLEEPAQAEGLGKDGAANTEMRQARSLQIPAELADLDTSLVTADGPKATDSVKSAREQAQSGPKPAAAAPRKAVVYTPAQIRAAYGLAPVPRDTGSLSAAERAALGAGQTIYIVGAYNNPTLLADLAIFNKRFELPTCREVVLPVDTNTLAPADPNEGCTISVVYSNMGARISTKPPKYNATWAIESALDVQWAHATAPLARIVVFEGLNNFANSFADSLMLANRFGPGVVSMSFVAGEGTYTEKYEAFLKGEGMTYFAAAGDRGTQANWPATSPQVIAVGGTTLAGYDGENRLESTWIKSGGGYSAFFPAPEYQSALPATTAVTGRTSTQPFTKPRATSDVSFNADPYTGQYTVFTKQGATAPSWYSMGGTSIGTPQWAGIVAIANAQRALSGRGTLGHMHSALYRQIGLGVGAAAGSLADVTTGTNGACSGCTASSGFDIPTGFGTPNAARLLPVLVGLSTDHQ